MTDKTYRIKPLVWKADCAIEEGGSVYAHGALGCSVVVTLENNIFDWSVLWDDAEGSESVDGTSETLDAAKLAAEAAYRALLIEALEEVVS